MTTSVRTPILRAKINGRIDPLCLSARATFSFELRVAQAEANFPRRPDATEWDRIELDMGPTAAQAFTRFAGDIVEIRSDLYPNLWTLIARGTLIRAEMMHGQEDDLNPDGIDLTNAGAGQTDQAMVTQILQTCGVPNLNIGGTGKVLGTIADDQFFWNSQISGLSVIEDIEEATLGYRTFNTPAGACVRRQIRGSPASTAVYTFTQGVDIERADHDETVLEVFNLVHVSGYDDIEAIVQQGSPFLPPGITTRRKDHSSPKIERELEADPGDGISCEEVAKWILEEVNRRRSIVTFTTPEGMLLVPGMTIKVDADTRLGTTRNYWLREVTTEVTEQGEFSQHLVCVGGDQSSAPFDTLADPIADFTVTVDVEPVVVAGTQVDRYFVFCDGRVSVPWGAEITTYAWSASAGTPNSGSDPTFLTVLDSLTGVTITLTVTDANGNTDQITKTITEAVPEAQRVTRRLFAAANVEAEAMDGVDWNTDPPSAGNVTVVANGPLWSAGSILMVSDDDLATSATESQPFGASENVTAIWIETDNSTSQVLIGSSAGRIGYSTDGGTTFSVKDGPSGNAIVRCIISRFTPGQFHVLTANGYYVSDNYGDGWRLIRAAASGQTFNDLYLSHTRNVIASSVSGTGAPLERAEDGTPFTFPALTPSVSNVVAVVGDIVEDRFYCYDDQGRTFFTTADGGTALSQGASLPDPLQPQVRGLWRDGAIKELLYVANGTAGLYKSVDGLATSGGYYQLRTPGTEGANASANYKQVGADGLLKRREITETTIVSKPSANAGPGESVKVLSLGSPATTPPSGWNTQIGFNDTAWDDTVVAAGLENNPIAGTTAIWNDSAEGAELEECIFRHVFPLGTGVVKQATFTFRADDVQKGAWLNGVFLGQELTPSQSGSNLGPDLVVTVDPSILKPGEDNLLAVWVLNDAPLNNPTSPAWASYKLEIR